MRTILWTATIAGLAGITLFFARSSHGEPAATAAAEPVKKPFGLEKRELWTTSRVKGSPEPPPTLSHGKGRFPKMKFTEPLELTPVPGKKAWIVAERGGKVLTFDDDASASDGPNGS